MVSSFQYHCREVLHRTCWWSGLCSCDGCLSWQRPWLFIWPVALVIVSLICLHTLGQTTRRFQKKLGRSTFKPVDNHLWWYLFSEDWHAKQTIHQHLGSDPSALWHLNLYKDKGEALDSDSNLGLKHTDQAIKLMEHVLDTSKREMVNIAPCSLALCMARAAPMLSSSMDSCKRSILPPTDHCILFVDLEKAFDYALKKILLLELRSLGVEEWT